MYIFCKHKVFLCIMTTYKVIKIRNRINKYHTLCDLYILHDFSIILINHAAFFFSLQFTTYSESQTLINLWLRRLRSLHTLRLRAEKALLSSLSILNTYLSIWGGRVRFLQSCGPLEATNASAYGPTQGVHKKC